MTKQQFKKYLTFDDFKNLFWFGSILTTILWSYFSLYSEVQLLSKNTNDIESKIEKIQSKVVVIEAKQQFYEFSKLDIK